LLHKPRTYLSRRSDQALIHVVLVKLRLLRVVHLQQFDRVRHDRNALLVGGLVSPSSRLRRTWARGQCGWTLIIRAADADADTAQARRRAMVHDQTRGTAPMRTSAANAKAGNPSAPKIAIAAPKPTPAWPPTRCARFQFSSDAIVHFVRKPNSALRPVRGMSRPVAIIAAPPSTQMTPSSRGFGPKDARNISSCKPQSTVTKRRTRAGSGAARRPGRHCRGRIQGPIRNRAPRAAVAIGRSQAAIERGIHPSAWPLIPKWDGIGSGSLS
jgi:hypothetical protein